MFERIKKAVKNWFMRAAADTGLGREFRSIFELDGVPAFQQFYNFGIFPWKFLYKGYYEAWHLIPAPTVKDANAKRRMAYLNLSKAVCSELAGMVWTDQTQVNVSTNGRSEDGDTPDPLQVFVDDVFKKNDFGRNMLDAVEKAA